MFSAAWWGLNKAVTYLVWTEGVSHCDDKLDKLIFKVKFTLPVTSFAAGIATRRASTSPVTFGLA